MAARSLGRIARLNPLVSHRCTVPVVGRLGAVSNSHRDNREDDRYVRALVSQTRDIHVTRRSESTVLLAGAGVAVSAMVARYGLEEYKKYQVSSHIFSAEQLSIHTHVQPNGCPPRGKGQ